MRISKSIATMTLLSAVLVACGGKSNDNDGGPAPAPAPAPAPKKEKRRPEKSGGKVVVKEIRETSDSGETLVLPDTEKVEPVEPVAPGEPVIAPTSEDLALKALVENDVFVLKADRKLSLKRVGSVLALDYLESSDCRHLGEVQLAATGEIATLSKFEFRASASASCKNADAAQAAMKLIVREDGAPFKVMMENGLLVLAVENGNNGGKLAFERIGTTSTSKDFRTALTGNWNLVSARCTADADRELLKTASRPYVAYEIDLAEAKSQLRRTRSDGQVQLLNGLTIVNLREDAKQFTASLRLEFGGFKATASDDVSVRLLKGAASELRMSGIVARSGCPYNGVTYVYGRAAK